MWSESAYTHIGHFFVQVILYLALNIFHFHQPSLLLSHNLSPTYHSSIYLQDGEFAIKRLLIVNGMVHGSPLTPPSAGRFTASRPWNGFIFHQLHPSGGAFSGAKGQSGESNRSVKPPSEINLWSSQPRDTVAQEVSTSHRQIQSGNSRVHSDKSKACQRLLNHTRDAITTVRENTGDILLLIHLDLALFNVPIRRETWRRMRN